MADDHGREALGCYGNPVVKTPNLDRLATQGTRFTHAFCTTASCSPSRSVLLTGLHNHANGMYGLEHREPHFNSFDTVRALPVLLEKAGYRTARIGKSHSLHEVTMYYPMRVLHERRYKLIFNIAHPLTFPMALDLKQSLTWKDIERTKRQHYGKRPVTAFLHRARFELYDLERDPAESHNLAWRATVATSPR